MNYNTNAGKAIEYPTPVDYTYQMVSKSQDDKLGAVKQWLGSGSINVFGMPFSGKDTQCQRLADLLGAATFGGGDILRNSPVTNHLTAEINKGNLAPTDEYIATVLPYFQRPEFNARPLVLSSVGRWLGEEQAIIKAASDSDHKLKAIIFLHLDHDEAVKRRQVSRRGRVDDDSGSKLDTRFREFATKTHPVLDIYRQKGLLIEVDGRQTPDQVTDAIIDALYTFSKKTISENT